MYKAAIKSVLAHKLRLLLTALAVVLGVAFVSGSYVFTDTIQARFDTLFADVFAGVDATVRPTAPEFGELDASLSIDTTLLETVQATPGVAQAAGHVAGYAQIISPEGEPVGGQGPPTLGGSWVDVPALNAFQIAEGNGRPPAAPDEIAIDVATAEAQGFKLGDSLEVQVSSGLQTFTLVGLASFGSENNLAGATFSLFTLPRAQELFGLEGRFTQIDIVAEDGTDPAQLVASLAAAVPEGVEAVSGEQQGDEQNERFTEGLGFLTTALLAFAGVAVFVGAFLIHNTFRIIVAQRTKELALLRALGASRRQVTGMVLIEALVVGVLASAIGVAAGVGFALLLKAGMGMMGMNPPDGPLTIAPRTVLVAMTVGVVVTLVSAWLPARRAGRTAPLAALREVAAGQPPLRRRALAGLGLSAAGAALLVAGLLLENGSSLYLVGGGALVVFLGVSVLAPLFARPIVSVVGSALPGLVGRLARGNTVRQPRRTAATASALMIGVALVALVSIFGASIKGSVNDSMERAFPADLALQSGNFLVGVSPEAVERVKALPEIETVSVLRQGEVRLNGEVTGLAAVDPSTIEQVYSPEASVPIEELGAGLLVSADALEKQGWHVGDELPLEYADGETVPTVIRGTFADRTFGDYLISSDTYAAHFSSGDGFLVLTSLRDGIELAAGKAAAEKALADFPGIYVNTRADQIAQTQSQVDQMLSLFSALLGLAVIIAVVGIANTLALTTVERTREIGLLRAVGMERRQVRRMIRWEAVMTAVFGAILGIAVGVLLGWAVVQSMADDGLNTFVFPGLQVLALLAIAVVAGVVAAIAPARKASRMKVLEAITFE
jgi:putative ABC transport system permease protein